MLAKLDLVDIAVSRLRRALLSGADVTALMDEFAGFAAEALTVAGRRASGGGQNLREVRTTDADSCVTKVVTKPDTAPAEHGATRQAMSRRRAGDVQRARDVPAHSGGHTPPLDLDTVRLKRAPEGSSADWTVIAGPDDQPVYVGRLEAKWSMSGSRTRRWIAQRPFGTTVPGGPWKTRQDALVRLVDDHVRRAERDVANTPGL